MLMAWAPPTLGVVDKFNLMEEVEVYETDYGAFDSFERSLVTCVLCDTVDYGSLLSGQLHRRLEGGHPSLCIPAVFEKLE